jgi:hypothetical protein
MHHARSGYYRVELAKHQSIKTTPMQPLGCFLGMTMLTYRFALQSILTRMSMTLVNRPQLPVVVSIIANLATLPSREARLPTR